MAYHAFRHHGFQAAARLISMILCQILSPTDKLCQIATGRTTPVPLTRAGRFAKLRASTVLPNGFYCYYYCAAWRLTHENTANTENENHENNDARCRVVCHHSRRCACPSAWRPARLWCKSAGRRLFRSTTLIPATTPAPRSR